MHLVTLAMQIFSSRFGCSMSCRPPYACSTLQCVSVVPQLGRSRQLTKLGTQSLAKAAKCLTWFLCMQIEGRERRRYPPHPLATLDMQKTATRVLRMPGE